MRYLSCVCFISDELLSLLAQVTYRDKPLSYYLLNMEAAANTQLTCAEDDVPQCRTGCSQEEVLTGLWKRYLFWTAG